MVFFKSQEYQSDLKRKNQTIRYSGVGAHHHNGVAERSMHTVSESARTMLIHSAIHWLQEMLMDLWPFDMDYATYTYNWLPKSAGGLSPIQIFLGAKLNSSWIA